MTMDFSQTKEILANQLGGELVEYNSAMVIARQQLSIQFYEHPDSRRPLEFRIISRLDRDRKQGTSASIAQDARPRIDGLSEILLRRKTEDDRKGLRSWLNRDVRTDDPDFDQLVHVESEAPDEHLRTVLSKDSRRIVKTLLENHCEYVGINTQHGELVVKFRAIEPDEESLPLVVEQLKWVIGEVLSLRASLPLFAGDAKAVRRFPRVKWAYYIELLWFSGLVPGIVMFGLERRPIDEQTYLALLGRGLGAAVLFVPLAWLLARGHCRGAKHFYGLIVLGLFAFPLGTLGFGVATNTLLDTSRPQTHRVTALAKPKWCTKTAGNPSHSVRVLDWRDSNRVFILNLSMAQCYAAQKGDIFVVVVKEGFWNWPWIKDVQAQR